jgi:hypothetical protein
LKHAKSLYQKLEREVISLYYGGRDRWIDVMAHAIAPNGSFVHTHRMVQQFVLNADLHRADARVVSRRRGSGDRSHHAESEPHIAARPIELRSEL